MPQINRRIRAALCATLSFIALCFLSAGCAGPRAAPTAQPLPPPQPVNPRDLGAEIRRLESLLANAEDDAPAELHLELALLHLDAANPSPNYASALNQLEAYVALEPSGRSRKDVGPWLDVLRRLDAAERERDALAARAAALAREAEEKERAAEKARREAQESRKTSEVFAKESADLGEAVKQLKKENQEMKETLEKLKALDIQLEILRKKTKQ